MKKILDFDGKKIIIEPFKVKHLSTVNKNLIPVFQAINAGQPLSSVLAKFTDNLISVVVDTGIADKEWLDEQSPSVLLEILIAVAEVNSDFFIQMTGAGEQQPVK